MDNPIVTFDPTLADRIKEHNETLELTGSEPQTVATNEVVTEEQTPEENAEDTAQIQNEADSEPSNQSFLEGAVMNIAEGAAAAPISLLDFGIDAAATVTSPVPGLGDAVQDFNESWDNMTRFKNPLIQKIREFTSIVVPTILPVGMATNAIRGLQLARTAKAGLSVAAAAGIDGIVIGLSDQGLEDNTVRVLSDTFPTVFGPEGAFPVPESWKTADGESPAVTKQKNILDSVAFSVVGDALGFIVSGAKPALSWFKPLDNKAKEYKQLTLLENNPETYKRIVDIDTALKNKPTPAEKRALVAERKKLTDQLNSSPVTDANTGTAYEKAILDANESRAAQIDEEAIRQLDLGITGYSPEINSKAAVPGSTIAQAIPPANVAHNKATVAAIKMGISEGDNVPLGSSVFWGKAVQAGNHREAIEKLVKEGDKAGEFAAIVDGFRITPKNMDESAWKIYADIMRAGADFKELREKFAQNIVVQDDGTKVKYFTNKATKAAFLAIQDLVDLYIGREVTASSARVMDTLGREITSTTEAARTFRELADDDAIRKQVGEKLEFLLAEHGLNSYIAGWTLQQRKGWFQKLVDNVAGNKDSQKYAVDLNKELNDIAKQSLEKARKFKQQLDIAAETSPELVTALFDTYSYTKGDVDSIHKLSQYFSKQFDIRGLFSSKATNGQMNELVRGFFNVRYNNILSGLAAAKATVGAGTLLITKPLTAMLGHGAEAVMRRDMEPIKRGLYFYSGWLQTHNRAMLDAVRRIKEVNHDPEAFMSAIRKDHQIINDGKWQTLDAISKTDAARGNFGNMFLYRTTKFMHNMAKMSVFRYGTTLMSGVDAYTDTFMATLTSRVKAYDDVFTKYGYVTPELLDKAERMHYGKLFDTNGVLNDKVAKYGSGEIAMNLDSELANNINALTSAYPVIKSFMMFPRTAVNYAKIGLSYTPIAGIPGITKQAETLYAGNNIDKIKQVLGKHGIDFDQTPNAIAVYENLRNEYVGRLMFGTGIVAALGGYAFAGNIRGNGPVSASERRKLRDNYNWRPKTIKVGDKWVSYEGLPMVEFMLATIGDMAYYAQDIGSSMSQDIAEKLAWTISATFLNNTPLQGLEPLLQIVNGDEAAAAQLAARELRSLIPLSGGLGTIARSIDSAQKDIYNDLTSYVAQNVPGYRNEIPNRIDYWTGNPINDFDNPFLRALNAVNPVQVTDDGEEWRQWLVNSGWTGFDFIKTSSKGVPYTAEQREAIGQLIGQQKLFEKVKVMMGNKSYNDEIAEMKELARKGTSFEDLELKASKMKVYRALNDLVRDAKLRAEQNTQFQFENPELRHTSLAQQRVDKLVERGQPAQAAKAAQQYQKEIDNLRKYNSLTP